MSFLPIVERELRVAARRKISYRIRLLAAVVASIMSFFFLLFAAGMGSTTGIGGAMFKTLTWYAFGICLLAGIFSMADSLSEEKREGTLGLLFLTDLRGYDVVLGKFAALSLNSLYSLLAIMPVLAATLLMGGVTGAEFWRVMLALVNVLFSCMAVGIFISAISREYAQSFGRAVALLLFLFWGTWLIDKLTELFHVQLNLSYASAWYTLYHAYDAYYLRFSNDYWAALFVSGGVAFFLLCVASLILPHVWQDRPVRQRRNWFQVFAGKQKQPGGFDPKRARLLDHNPVLWLIRRHGQFSVLAWGLALISIVLSVCFVFMDGQSFFLYLFYAMRPAILLPFKIVFVIQASRFFAASRRSGALELLASTPVRPNEVLSAQWTSLRQAFVWPAIVIWIAPLCGTIVSILLQSHSSSRTETGFLGLFGFGAFGYYGLVFVLDLLALGWLSIYLALTSPKPQFAPAYALLFIVVLPSITYCLPIDIFVDLGVFLWARGKVIDNFRSLLLPAINPVVVTNVGGPPAIPGRS